MAPRSTSRSTSKRSAKKPLSRAARPARAASKRPGGVAGRRLAATASKRRTASDQRTASNQRTAARSNAPRGARSPVRRASGLYSVHPSIVMVQTQMANLAERTGRDLHGWIEFLKTNGPKDEPSQREWLKTKFGLGTNYAWWIAERAAGRGWEDDDPEAYLRVAPEYVEKMYAGGKAALRPLHDAIIALVRRMFPEVKICPCQTIVPLYRTHVIAQVKPATRKRIDLGFALGDLPATGRLIDTGGFAKKDRITHRIPIESVDDLDAEVTGWLRKAWERDA